jgi:hypothetical protein
MFKNLQKQIRILLVERRDLLGGFVLVIAAGLAFELFVAGVDHWVEHYFTEETVKPWLKWYVGVCLALTLGLSFCIWCARNVFRKLHVRYQIHSEDMPKPYLVIFISQQSRLKNVAEIADAGPIKIPATNSTPEVTLLRISLLDDAKLIAETQTWPWEMVLRGIAPHLSALRRIYLVGSKDSPGKPGTFADRDVLRRFLLPYLVAAGKAATPGGAEHLIVPWPQPVDFESFAEVHDTLECIRNQLTNELAEDVELCVDITGGQKPTSAAAGLFTVNKDVVIQYVQTNPPKRAKMYDVRLLEWPKKPE